MKSEISAKTLGQLIKKLRTRAGLSQAQLATSIGITSVALSNWEQDKSQPSPTNMATLAAAFKIPIGIFNSMVTYSPGEELLNLVGKLAAHKRNLIIEAAKLMATSDNAIVTEGETIGSLMKKYRKKLKYTQLDIANALGCNLTTIIRWEQDKFEPNEEYLYALARLLQIPAPHLTELSQNTILTKLTAYIKSLTNKQKSLLLELARELN